MRELVRLLVLALLVLLLLLLCRPCLLLLEDKLLLSPELRVLCLRGHLSRHLTEHLLLVQSMSLRIWRRHHAGHHAVTCHVASMLTHHPHASHHRLILQL
jgi:hypothetical protein